MLPYAYVHHGSSPARARSSTSTPGATSVYRTTRPATRVSSPATAPRDTTDTAPRTRAPSPAATAPGRRANATTSCPALAASRPTT